MRNGLSDEQWKTLRDDLVQLAEELEHLIELASESSQPVDLDQPIGRLSRMDALQNQQMAQANEKAHRARLSLAQEALEAFADGTYGLCVACDRPVGFERLKALPEATACLACQERSDRP